jgi:hypothetical protein
VGAFNWAPKYLIDKGRLESSSAWAELFARDNCEPRSKNAL